jgi:hypothetical protein
MIKETERMKVEAVAGYMSRGRRKSEPEREEIESETRKSSIWG